MKTLVKTALLFLLFLQTACGQPKKLNGVYAGIQIMPGVTMGGGMDRYDYVYLFRPDGTYTDELEKPDWKTRVNGTYTLSGNTITVTANKGKNRTSTYKLNKDGDIDAGGYYLLHQPMDSNIPPGFYKFSKMSSMGGGSSGMVYVGTATDDGLYFDGKGNFSNDHQNQTAVIGESVGGGGGKKSSGQGTYTISKGVLTLKYSDGRTVVHSFFCRPGYKPIMAAVDGDIYFMKDPKEGAKGQTKQGVGNKTSGKSSTTSNTGGNASSETNTSTTAPADGKALLLKANSIHGGATLDNLRTVSFTATLQGMQVNSYVDVAGRRVRLEARQTGKLVQLEQLDGQGGWQWQGGQTQPLPAVRISEMKSVFSSGILGLRKSQINTFTIKNIKQNGSAYSIICERDGKQYAFVLNAQGQMAASGDNAGQTFSTSLYSDLRQVDGLLLPFQEVATSGGRKNVIRYEKFEVNPNLPESVWAKP